MLDKREFRDLLERTLHEELQRNRHPIFSVLLDVERPNLPLMRNVATEVFQITKHFVTYIENLYFYCPDARHKRLLLTNLYEEETGKLSRTKNHIELMRDFYRALGVTDETVDAHAALPATRALVEYRMNAVRDPARYHVGAAAVMIASEGQSLESEAAEKRDSLFGRTYGLSAKDTLFFTVHRNEDVGHVQQGLSLVSDICRDERTQREALEAIRITTRLFHEMYEGMSRQYHANFAAAV
jgi:pyrroloquinoline-quinone synthase